MFKTIYLKKSLLPLAIALYCTSSAYAASVDTSEKMATNVDQSYIYDYSNSFFARSNVSGQYIGNDNLTYQYNNGIDISLNNNSWNTVSSTDITGINNGNGYKNITINGTEKEFYVKAETRGVYVYDANDDNAILTNVSVSSRGIFNNQGGSMTINAEKTIISSVATGSQYSGTVKNQLSGNVQSHGLYSYINASPILVNGGLEITTTAIGGQFNLTDPARAYANAYSYGIRNDNDAATTISGQTIITAYAGGGRGGGYAQLTANAYANGILNSSDMEIGDDLVINVMAVGGDITESTASIVGDYYTNYDGASAYAYGIKSSGIGNYGNGKEYRGSTIIKGTTFIFAIADAPSINTNSSTESTGNINAYAYGINSIANVLTLEKDTEILALATSAAGKAYAYAVYGMDGTININPDNDKNNTVKLTGDIYARDHIGAAHPVININLSNDASFLRGNIMTSNNGIVNLTLANQSVWQPVYDNRNGSSYLSATNYNSDISTVKTLSLSGGIIDLTFTDSGYKSSDRASEHLYRTVNIGTLNIIDSKTGPAWTNHESTGRFRQGNDYTTSGAFFLNTDVSNKNSAEFGDRINIGSITGDNATLGIKVLYDRIVENTPADKTLTKEYFINENGDKNTYNIVNITGEGKNKLTLKGIQSVIGAYYCIPVFDSNNNLEYLFFSPVKNNVPDNPNNGENGSNNPPDNPNNGENGSNNPPDNPNNGESGSNNNPGNDNIDLKETTPLVQTVAGSSTVQAFLPFTDQLRKHLRDLRSHPQQGNSPWIMAYNGDLSYNKYIHTGFDYKGIQGGFDKSRQTNSGIYYDGAAISYTTSNNSFSYGSGDAGVLDFSLYRTWTGNKGHYYDLIARYGRINNKFQVANEDDIYYAANYKTTFHTLSAEYGYKKQLNNGWQIEPKAALTYGRVRDTAYKTGTVQVKQDDLTRLIGRAGISVAKKLDNDTQIYASLSALHEFNGKQHINVSGIAFDQDYSGTWYEASLGVSATLGKNSHAYLDLEKSFSGNLKSNWQINAGCSWSF